MMKNDTTEETMDKRNIVIEQYLDKIKAQIYKISPVDAFINELRQDLYDYAETNLVYCTVDI